MSEFRDVVPGLAVAPQLAREDFARAAAEGFRTVICNRPDGEEPGQLTLADAEALAQEAGLSFVAIPVAGGFALEDIDATEAALASNPGPVLAYCRSGTRSVTLWALAAAKSRAHTPLDILQAARSAGYDLSNIAPMLARLYGPVG